MRHFSSCSSACRFFMPNDKELYGVGSNKFGQIGVGTITQQYLMNYVKIPLNFIHESKKIKLISTGTRHTLILLDDSFTLFGAGENADG